MVPLQRGEVGDLDAVAEQGREIAAPCRALGQRRSRRGPAGPWRCGRPPGSACRRRSPRGRCRALCRRASCGGAEIAVAIADRDDGDPRRRSAPSRRRRSRRVAARDGADLDDAALERRPPARIGLAAAGVGLMPYSAAPGRTTSQWVGGTEKDAGRIGERGGDAAKHHAQLAEQLDLAAVERVVGRIRAGEMGHDERNAVVGHLHACARRAPAPPRSRSRAGSCRCRNAAPRRRASRWRGRTHPTRRASAMLPITGRAWASAQAARAAGRDAVEHIDDGLGRDGAHLARLRQMGDEERPAADLGEQRRHRLDAAAIGVGLDDGGAIGRRHALGTARRQLASMAARSMVSTPPVSIARGPPSIVMRRGRPPGRLCVLVRHGASAMRSAEPPCGSLAFAPD